MFRVEWRDGAVNEHAGIWMQADSNQRSAITEATNIVDEELRTDPIGSSESRERDDRVLFEQPLGILFQVDLAGQNVWVDHVWYYAQHTIIPAARE